LRQAQRDQHGNDLIPPANPAVAVVMNVPQGQVAGLPGGAPPPAVVQAQPAAVQAVAPYQPVFAAVPALVYQDFLDYQVKSQLEIFISGTKPLKTEFDCSEQSLKTFIDQLSMKITEFSWSQIFLIPVGNQVKNLLTEWGQISMQDVSQRLQVIHTAQSRDHQNSCMSGLCIFNSLTAQAQNKVSASQDLFRINGHISGPILFRALIGCTHVDTRASVDRYKRKLEQLDLLMVECKSDIQAFNQEVDRIRTELSARGEFDTSLLTHLLQGYEAAADKEFVNWIKRHHDNLDDGTVAMTPEQLMQMAARKYADRTKQDTWAKPDAQEQRIIALNTKISKLENKKGGGAKGKKDDKSSGEDGKPKDKAKKDEWKFKPPKEGASKTKSMNGKTYHYCMNHNQGKGMWVLHDPKECRLAVFKPKPKSTAPGPSSLKPKVRFNVNSTSIEEEVEQDSD
jgi:hypothetical protein